MVVEKDLHKKLSKKELIELIWNIRGELYLLASNLQRIFEKEEKKEHA